MMSLFFTALSLFSAQADAERSSQPPPPTVPDARYEHTIRPTSLTLTSEWTCDGSPEASRATILIRDVGGRQRNRFFQIALTDLRWEGEAVARSVFRRVEGELRALNMVEAFQGECRFTEEYLRVTGFAYDGTRHIRKSLELALQP
jgi:hypothetical protein